MIEEYTLTPPEQLMATMLANMRQQISRSIGRVDQKIGTQSGWDTDLQGIGGEFAAARIYNVYPSLELVPDEGYDIVINDKKVDVKTTVYKNGRLLAKLNARLDEVDMFMLMVGEFPTFKLMGWASVNDLCNDKNIIDLGRGPGYGLEQRQLKVGKIK
jgi:hypothetical protein